MYIKKEGNTSLNEIVFFFFFWGGEKKNKKKKKKKILKKKFFFFFFFLWLEKAKLNRELFVHQKGYPVFLVFSLNRIVYISLSVCLIGRLIFQQLSIS